MIPEYIIMIGSIAALIWLAVALQRRTNYEVSQRADWQDLNEMMSKVYHDNDNLRSDLHRAGKQVALLQSVNANLKSTVEDMYHGKQQLLEEMNKLTRAMDGLEQQIAYMTSPPDPANEITSDDLDEWYESQAKSEDNKVPPSTDLFNTLRDTFLNPIPPADDDNE
jgi:predicted  nucleic acid-binding Zn-ribbon protein